MVNTDPNGHWVHILAGAGLGALVSYGAQVAGNVRDGGLSPEAFTDVDWRQVGAGAVAGGVGAATFGAGMAAAGAIGIRGVGATVLSNVVSGQVATMAQGLVMGQCSFASAPSLDDLAWYAIGPLANKAAGMLRPVGSVSATKKALEAVASTVAAAMGPGSGPVYGTRSHIMFKTEVQALGRADLKTEVSHLAGSVVPWVTPGSIRVDVVKGAVSGPEAVYGLKTGTAKLSTDRIEEIRKHVGIPDLPILEIRP